MQEEPAACCMHLSHSHETHLLTAGVQPPVRQLVGGHTTTLAVTLRWPSAPSGSQARAPGSQGASAVGTVVLHQR